MMRKINQRSSQITASGGGLLGDARADASGHRKIARKPVSASWISHP
jgi:hypothetical protein